MTLITSRSNGLIVGYAKLKDKKYRDRTGLFLSPGKKLFSELLLSGHAVRAVFCTEKYADQNALPENVPAYTVTEDVLRRLSDEQSPDGIVAVAEKRISPVTPEGFVLICDGIQDPGNLGTVLRSARAFGCSVILSAGCADLYSQKVLRGAMGAAFSEKITTGVDTAAAIKTLRQNGYGVYAAALHTNAVPLYKSGIKGKCAVVIGNEGHGLSEETVASCDGAVVIEMEPESESLNAAVAASLIMYRHYTGELYGIL